MGEACRTCAVAAARPGPRRRLGAGVATSAASAPDG